MKRTLIMTLLLVLAACSGPEAPPAGSNEAAEVTAADDGGIVATPTDPVPVASPTPTPGPTPTATQSPAVATAAQANTFPPAYRGRWGMNANDCDPRRDDNKGLITIAAERISFYESRARIAKLTVSSPTRLAADLSFSGEGQTWQSRTVFDLADGGRTMLRSEESPAGSYRYAKCPAA